MGNTTRCAICESVNHWAQDCPDKGSGDFNTYYAVLCQSDYDHPNKVKNLVAELWNAAFFDSGASKTVYGQSWFIDCYIESLNESDKSKVSYNEASNFNSFGDGKRVCSTKSVLSYLLLSVSNQSLLSQMYMTLTFLSSCLDLQ